VRGPYGVFIQEKKILNRMLPTTQVTIITGSPARIRTEQRGAVRVKLPQL